MTVVRLKEKEKKQLTDLVSGISDKSARQRSFVSMMGVTALANLAAELNLSVDVSNSLSSNTFISTEFDIADIKIAGSRFDVRAIVGEEYPQIWIPREHIDYGIVPDFYVACKVNSKLSKSEVLGFIQAPSPIGLLANKRYYIVDASNLRPISELPDVLNNFISKKVIHLKAEHRKTTELFASCVEKNISKESLIYLLNHIFYCDTCRKDFNIFCRFDKIFSSVKDPNSTLEEIASISSVAGVVGLAAGAAAIGTVAVAATAEIAAADMVEGIAEKAGLFGKIKGLFSKKSKSDDNEISETEEVVVQDSEEIEVSDSDLVAPNELSFEPEVSEDVSVYTDADALLPGCEIIDNSENICLCNEYEEQDYSFENTYELESNSAVESGENLDLFAPDDDPVFDLSEYPSEFEQEQLLEDQTDISSDSDGNLSVDTEVSLDDIDEEVLKLLGIDKNAINVTETESIVEDEPVFSSDISFESEEPAVDLFATGDDPVFDLSASPTEFGQEPQLESQPEFTFDSDIDSNSDTEVSLDDIDEDVLKLLGIDKNALNAGVESDSAAIEESVSDIFVAEELNLLEPEVQNNSISFDTGLSSDITFELPEAESLDIVEPIQNDIFDSQVPDFNKEISFKSDASNDIFAASPLENLEVNAFDSVALESVAQCDVQPEVSMDDIDDEVLKILGIERNTLNRGPATVDDLDEDVRSMLLADNSSDNKIEIDSKMMSFGSDENLFEVNEHPNTETASFDANNLFEVDTVLSASNKNIKVEEKLVQAETSYTEASIDHSDEEQLISNEEEIQDEPEESAVPRKRRKASSGKNAKLVKIAAAVVIVGVIGGCGYSFIFANNGTPDITPMSASNPVQPTTPGTLEGQPVTPESAAQPAQSATATPETKLSPEASAVDQAKTQSAKNQNLNEVLASALVSQGNEIKITNLSWQISASMAGDAVFNNYLMLTGQALKLALSKNLLVAHESAYNDIIKVGIVLDKKGSIVSTKIKSGSGSAEIDKIIIQTIQDTFSYTKLPVIETKSDTIKATVIISL